MPGGTTCPFSDQCCEERLACRLRPHQQAFLDTVPGGGLAGAKMVDWFTECPPVNKYCLTEAEQISLIAYTTNTPLCYNGSAWNGAALNKELRRRRPSRDMENYRDTLKDALARLLPGPRWVVRRTTLPDHVLDRYRKGATVCDRGFTSASGCRFADWQGEHLFWIDSKTGKQISHYSSVDNGEEVLFPPGTRFRVTCRRDLTGNRVNFELREI